MSKPRTAPKSSGEIMWRLTAGVMMAALALAGCASMDDMKRGTGKTLEIRDRSYDEIWQATLKVADEHFEILEKDKVTGVIKAERTTHFSGEIGDSVRIFITPPTPGADNYVVEIVKREKLKTQVKDQDVERKVLRDIRNVLDGQPIR